MTIKIHVFHTDEVCVAPDLRFGGDHSNVCFLMAAMQERARKK